MMSISSVAHFALVVCADGTSSELLLKSLAAHNAAALNVFNYETWAGLNRYEPYDLLWIKKDGSHIYATDHAKKEEMAKAILACVSKRARQDNF